MFTNDEIRVYRVQCCVRVILNVLELPQVKWNRTFELHFWPIKHQKGHALDQPCSLFPIDAIEDGLVGAKTSRTLAEEVDESSMG